MTNFQVVDQLAIPENNQPWEKHETEQVEHTFIEGWEIHRFREGRDYCVRPIEAGPEWDARYKGKHPTFKGHICHNSWVQCFSLPTWEEIVNFIQLTRFLS